MTTGAHVAQICWFLLIEARFVPAKILQLSPPRRERGDVPPTGSCAIIDIDLSRYDADRDPLPPGPGRRRVCRREPTASAAGRALFAASRMKKASANDADRLRKYLARFGLDWAAVRASAA
ncbi:RNA repair transcriptional activator RtcR family protein [Methylopila musalis]|uniref:RNA repair transcriptional activator RtcR family protein n=1 Tax=Methylopila musalis TaxID=1134781 RepID=A0ABW3Z407_9HYPH